MLPACFFVEGLPTFFPFGHPARNNNMHKTLLSFADREVLLPEPFQPKLTFKDPYKDQVQMMLLSHEMFSAVYHSYQEAWLSMMVPAVGRLAEFWDLQEKHPAFTDHPALQANPHFRSRLVPIALRGNGTPGPQSLVLARSGQGSSQLGVGTPCWGRGLQNQCSCKFGLCLMKLVQAPP